MTASAKTYGSFKTLNIPAQVTCLAAGGAGQLLVGSDDGSVRVYDLSSFKVTKAIRGLASVSSVSWQSQSASQRDCLWLASGRSVIAFTMNTDKLVLTVSDAHLKLDVGSDDNDAVNELTMNKNGDQVAFCLDSGVVGVINLCNNEVSQMRNGHDSVCGSVRFVPNRPGELVTGGYDSALLHFDVLQGRLLSRDDLRAIAPSSGLAMSPPFILSLGISPSGVLAAGTADGRIYVGTSGEISGDAGGARRNRRRKWEGLRSDGRILVEVAQGPVTALAFTSPREFLTCSLLGSVSSHGICGPVGNTGLTVRSVWNRNVEDIFKVNAMVVCGNLLVLGGFQKDGTGIIEIWEERGINATDTSTTASQE
ncbi:WD40-repeat-containing domain protein [Pisolithus croceorrhizus]|nr:WD40-repeat-containing domain protein [Pisolithus croceorrhizus]KAI6127813.1 WD40-repeat-containing domain protein [Pisolithus croceorrhizus]